MKKIILTTLAFLIMAFNVHAGLGEWTKASWQKVNGVTDVYGPVTIEGDLTVNGTNSASKVIVERSDGTDVLTVKTTLDNTAILTVESPDNEDSTAIAGVRDAASVLTTTIAGGNHMSAGVFLSGKTTNNSHIALHAIGERHCSGTCSIATASAGALKGEYQMHDGDYNNASNLPLSGVQGWYTGTGSVANTTDYGAGVYGYARTIAAGSTITWGSAFQAMGCEGTTGTITNCAGLLVFPQTEGATNNYGIVLDGDGVGSSIVFGDNQEVWMSASGNNLMISNSAEGLIENASVQSFAASTNNDCTGVDTPSKTPECCTGAGTGTCEDQGYAGTAMTNSMTRIHTVTNADDTATMPEAATGAETIIVNAGANQLKLWPAVSDRFGANAADTAITVASVSMLTCKAVNPIIWYCVESTYE